MDVVTDEEVAAFRQSSQFDERWYVERYPDVKLLGIDPARHYLWIGQKLGREPKPVFSQDVRDEARKQIKRTESGNVEKTEYLCLFSHFDLHDEIDDYVIDYLKSLHDCGYSTVFITTCENISSATLSFVRDYVFKIIVKKNVGRDFGSWFAGIVDSWRPNSFRKVLLANDSVYGPIFDLKSVFEDMSDRSLDLWGITDSFETEYHVQSYFVVFEERFANSAAFIKFWDSYRFEVDKRKVIENFEIGLTSFAVRSGFRAGAFCSYYDVRRRALALMDTPSGTGTAVRQSKLTPVNGSHFFWRSLVKDFQCPFIKVELLRDNPSGIDDVFLWEDVIVENSSFKTELINSHLKRIKNTGKILEGQIND